MPTRPTLTLEVNAVLEGVKKLSPAPQILPKLQKLLKNEYVSLESVTELIRLDTALSAQIIRLSNSVLFRATTSCKSIDQACQRLGFKEIYHTVSMAAAKEALSRGAPLYGLDAQGLWDYSLAVAIFMEEMSKQTTVDTDIAYTVGLLHSLGQVVISEFFLQNPQMDCPTPPLLPDQEEALLGITSTQIGHALLTQWNFPAEITEPILYQKNPLDARKFSTIGALLYTGILLVPFIHDGNTAIERIVCMYPQMTAIKDLLKISDQDIVWALQSAHQKYTFIRNAIGCNTAVGCEQNN